MEVSYKYETIFFSKTNDTLQRFGNVKIETTSFTISKLVELMEISPHLMDKFITQLSKITYKK